MLYRNVFDIMQLKGIYFLVFPIVCIHVPSVPLVFPMYRHLCITIRDNIVVSGSYKSFFWLANMCHSALLAGREVLVRKNPLQSVRALLAASECAVPL